MLHDHSPCGGPPQTWASRGRRSSADVCVCSVMSDSATPWTVAPQAPLSVDFPGKNME